ncbi:MAG: glycosyltransferase, partial [Lachnospiraceae bacterium]|nr:glycosyltransferase [Lachnospiraceae bacterium]
MEDLVSIIVPVFNVEKYLEKCLESIEIQTYGNLEVILVEDGSLDFSGKICKEFARRDRRFKVICQKNQGVLAARKTGLNVAAGKYVCFVDSDDWIDRDMIRILYQSIQRNGSDIAVCRKIIYDENLGISYEEEQAAAPGIYRKKQGINEICSRLFWGKDGRTEGLGINLVDKMFERKLLSRHHEQVDTRLRYFEDGACLVPCLMEADSVSVVDQALYYYRQRTGSACHSVDRLYLEQLNLFYDFLMQRIENEDMAERLDRYLIAHVYSGINEMMGIRIGKRIPFYMPPMAELAGCEKIVLYGAGKVGSDYYHMMHLMCPERIAGWVDRQYLKYRRQGMDIEAPERLKTW